MKDFAVNFTHFGAERKLYLHFNGKNSNE